MPTTVAPTTASMSRDGSYGPTSSSMPTTVAPDTPAPTAPSTPETAASNTLIGSVTDAPASPCDMHQSPQTETSIPTAPSASADTNFVSPGQQLLDSFASPAPGADDARSEDVITCLKILRQAIAHGLVTVDQINASNLTGLQDLLAAAGARGTDEFYYSTVQRQQIDDDVKALNKRQVTSLFLGFIDSLTAAQIVDLTARSEAGVSELSQGLQLEALGHVATMVIASFVVWSSVGSTTKTDIIMRRADGTEQLMSHELHQHGQKHTEQFDTLYRYERIKAMHSGEQTDEYHITDKHIYYKLPGIVKFISSVGNTKR